MDSNNISSWFRRILDERECEENVDLVRRDVFDGQCEWEGKVDSCLSRPTSNVGSLYCNEGNELFF